MVIFDEYKSSGILIGRPYGGTAVLWRKTLANRIELLEHDETDGKFLSFKLCTSDCSKDVIITCVYFPCLTTVNNYILNSANVIGHIEHVSNSYADAEHIIAGDFNFEFCYGNIGFELFKNVLSDYNFTCCDDRAINKSLGYTYCHESLNQQSWLDHFVVTENLLSCVRHFEIIDGGDNLSDHCPIHCVLRVPSLSKESVTSEATGKRLYKQRWDKADLMSYYMLNGRILQCVLTPDHLLHCGVGCQCDAHKSRIDKYYKDIVAALHRSALGCVPKIPFRCLNRSGMMS